MSAAGTLVAAAALLLNVGQFKRLDQSLRCNTYQQLAMYALGLYTILLEHPDLRYLTIDGSSGGQDEGQALFDRLLANFLENTWLQRQHGLIDGELAASYDALLLEIIKNHPGLRSQLREANLVESFRTHVAGLEQQLQAAGDINSSSQESPDRSSTLRARKHS